MKCELHKTDDNGKTFEFIGRFPCVENAVYFATDGRPMDAMINKTASGDYLVFLGNSTFLSYKVTKGVKKSAETTSE